jgi:glutathione peroxidase
MSESIYDIPLKSWDGRENMLNDYKGKVTMFINVTADCGNAPQYGVIETLYQKYKDQGFEVVAVPTNDYCGPGITYEEYECGITTPQEARDYAKELYDVSYDFSEMVVSMVGQPMSDELLAEKYPGRKEPFPRKLADGEEVHPLYKSLAQNMPMFGNFEKFLVDKNGKVSVRYSNSTLLDYAKNNGEKVTTSGEDYNNISNAIEELLTDKPISFYADTAGNKAQYAVVI